MSEGFDTDEIRSMIKAGGIFDDEVILRAKELIQSGDMDIDFMCEKPYKEDSRLLIR